MVLHNGLASTESRSIKTGKGTKVANLRIPNLAIFPELRVQFEPVTIFELTRNCLLLCFGGVLVASSLGRIAE